MSEVIRNQKPAKKDEIRLDELTSRFTKIFLDLKFQRPSVVSIATVLQNICQRENLEIDNDTI